MVVRDRPSCKWLLASAAALALGLVARPAPAADLADSVTVKPVQLYIKNNRARILLNVVNGSDRVLDIDVVCAFFDSEKKPLGTGKGQVSRLPPRRTDTLEVANEIAQPVETGRCHVADVHS